MPFLELELARSARYARAIHGTLRRGHKTLKNYLKKTLDIF